ncbi:hypothetical protein HUG15_04360 [Salicibibacter cibarius]|uniref:DUF3566 domain-containing protein n=1 Tax=Salicibibacter cibarius TaxID=2743000 RepID=A0A7T6Z0U0_9BACI|nr:hypothetical protein [Salicibibacter cibarius]QQK74910.1 hypothetical protein HUG15_04360 [Salicibibacter cibarius]
MEREKQIEIRKLTIPSVLKATSYFLVIPIALSGIFVIFWSLFITVLEGPMGLIGLPLFLIGVIFYVGLYFGITALVTLIYNLFAGKFGGLVMTVRDVDTQGSNYENHMDDVSQV